MGRAFVFPVRYVERRRRRRRRQGGHAIDTFDGAALARAIALAGLPNEELHLPIQVDAPHPQRPPRSAGGARRPGPVAWCTHRGQPEVTIVHPDIEGAPRAATRAAARATVAAKARANARSQYGQGVAARVRATITTATTAAAAAAAAASAAVGAGAGKHGGLLGHRALARPPLAVPFRRHVAELEGLGRPTRPSPPTRTRTRTLATAPAAVLDPALPPTRRLPRPPAPIAGRPRPVVAAHALIVHALALALGSRRAASPPASRQRVDDPAP